jgi:hypothetical protein
MNGSFREGQWLKFSSVEWQLWAVLAEGSDN